MDHHKKKSKLKDEILNPEFLKFQSEVGKSVLQKALIQGERSKKIINFNPKLHLAKLHKKYL